MGDGKIGQQFNGCAIKEVRQTMRSGAPYEDYDKNMTMKCTESQTRRIKEQAAKEGMDVSSWLRQAAKIRLRFEGYETKLLAYEAQLKSILDAMPDKHIPEYVWRSPE